MKQKYLLTLCKGEPEEEIVEAELTDGDVEIIKQSINGIFDAEYLITTMDGKQFNVGIIDNIETSEKG